MCDRINVTLPSLDYIFCSDLGVHAATSSTAATGMIYKTSLYVSNALYIIHW